MSSSLNVTRSKQNHPNRSRSHKGFLNRTRGCNNSCSLFLFIFISPHSNFSKIRNAEIINMPVYLLDEDIRFPDPGLANKDGLLAIGGDLSPERLLQAYSHGIFPWYSDDSPILWWSPDPRAVLFPENFKVSKSFRQIINAKKFSITFDNEFSNVMRHCAFIPREGQEGTWITDEMIDAYHVMHELGYAHSVEAYASGKLVGGLYGISIGKVFFGESMFHTMSDASKIALYYLVGRLKFNGFRLIDVQQKTRHLTSLGATMISRGEFMKILSESLREKFPAGKWE